MRNFDPPGTDPSALLAGLRVWAAGYAADEAAVELLALVAAEVPGCLNAAVWWGSPWLVPCPRPGVWSLDGAALAEAVESFPARLRPVLLVASALTVDGALVEIGTTLAAVPPAWIGPVFTALAHAAGCLRVQLVHDDQAEPGLFPQAEPNLFPVLDRVPVLDGAA